MVATALRKDAVFLQSLLSLIGRIRTSDRLHVFGEDGVNAPEKGRAYSASVVGCSALTR
jgi:hypothetical protein